MTRGTQWLQASRPTTTSSPAPVRPAACSPRGCGIRPLRVLLLEAGGKDSNPWIHVPLGYAKTFVDPRVNWMFDSEPEPQLEQPRHVSAARQGAGRHQLDQRHDLHARQSRRLRRVAPARLRRLGLRLRPAVFPQGRGQRARRRANSTAAGGPLRVSNQPYEWEIGRRCWRPASQAGIPHNPDFNGAQQEGAGYYQTTTNNRRRWSTAAAYLRPARKRPNLVIQTHAHATRVLIENGRAVGVEFRTPQGLRDRARRAAR